MITALLSIALVFLPAEVVCFFDRDPAVVSGYGADWSPLADSVRLDFKAGVAFNQSLNGPRQVVIPPTEWPEAGRWFVTVRPVPVLPEGVESLCLPGSLTGYPSEVFSDGFESGGLNAWSRSVP